MKQIVLPKPPNPDDPQYNKNPLAHQRAMFDWAQQVKGKLEEAGRINSAPAGQPIAVSSFTTNTAITGTTTGTDLSNAVCSIVQALISKGILTSNNGPGL